MTWLTVFHGDEPTFWRRMNPRRLDQLLAQYLRAAGSGPAAAAPAPGGSLSQYLMGGG